MLYYFKRAFFLRNKGIPVKQIIADANIWTTNRLDYLHFPFGTSILKREHYAALLGAKATISFRGSDVNVFPIYHQLSYAKFWPLIAKVHCNSSELLAKLQSEHDLSESMPSYIIHPALRNDYINDETTLNDIILKRDYTQEHFITIGRLHWIKDFVLTFNALAELKKQGLSFLYTIIGTGPEKEHLVYLAHELGIDQHINWLGLKHAHDIKKSMQKATLYIQSSYAEGFSNACIEAQSQGLSCIVNNVSGMHKCIEEGKTGVIVASRNSNDFAQAILQQVQVDPNERRKQSFYTASRALELFSLDKQRQQWQVFFD
jgi:colanic acid/amylovoran biosynthesis glycosyltransferase